MKLWIPLYLMVWVVFLECMLLMTPIFSIYLLYLHIAIGFVIVGLAYYNFSRLRATSVPGRVKRIARSSLQLSILCGALGILLYFRIGADWAILSGVTAELLILILHDIISFAIITQAAAVAIAHDMWEGKEFEKESIPGEVPPPQGR
jgi:uncharacterized membrane protein HdeD (DUF308 family)